VDAGWSGLPVEAVETTEAPDTPAGAEALVLVVHVHVHVHVHGGTFGLRFARAPRWRSPDGSESAAQRMAAVTRASTSHVAVRPGVSMGAVSKL
jgi:hypothetical protein